jgi:hypothetical protein
LLKRGPNRVAHRLFLPPKPRTPKSQHLDALFGKPRIANVVSIEVVRLPMLKSIHFDVERRLNAIKIQDVIAKGVLSSKSVIRESTASKPTPHETFSPGFLLSQTARQRSGSRRLLVHFYIASASF